MRWEPIDYPVGNNGFTGEAAISFCSALIYHGYSAYKKNLNRVIHEFLNYAVQSPLWRQGVSRKNQDWTLMVGIYKGFFRHYGIDCGLTDQEIRNSYMILAYKFIRE